MSEQLSGGPLHCVVGRVKIRKCGCCFPQRGVPVDPDGCILEKGHEGNHLFKAENNKFYSWQWDFCGCEDCMSDDPVDQCCVYSEVEEPNPSDQGADK